MTGLGGGRHRHRARPAVRLGVRPRWWRPPWGRTADFTQAVADAHGLGLVGWNVDTHDWRGDTAAAMLDATRSGLRPGAIVLAHDGIGPGAQRPDARETVRYVALAADLVRRAGVAFVALDAAGRIDAGSPPLKRSA